MYKCQQAIVNTTILFHDVSSFLHFLGIGFSGDGFEERQQIIGSLCQNSSTSAKHGCAPVTVIFRRNQPLSQWSSAKIWQHFRWGYGLRLMNIDPTKQGLFQLTNTTNSMLRLVPQISAIITWFYHALPRNAAEALLLAWVVVSSITPEQIAI